MPVLSVVVPAYNAAARIHATLASLRCGHSGVEVVVVDDGSEDRASLASVIAAFPDVKMVSHEHNRGMCAARNTGIRASAGQYVTILDADDCFADDWVEQFESLRREWPSGINVCFSMCRTEAGEITVKNPEFTGLLTLEDILNERQSGEYLPLFRGEYIRATGYVDIGTRKSCGILSYIRFAQESPFWVSTRVLRIYHARRPGSVSSDWTEPPKALETVACYTELLARYGELYVRLAPRVYRTKLLRYALYLAFAGRRGAWAAWWKAAHVTCLKETVAVFVLLLMGPGVSASLVNVAKTAGLIRRYG